jgi:hypothetical protein
MKFKKSFPYPVVNTFLAIFLMFLLYRLFPQVSHALENQPGNHLKDGQLKDAASLAPPGAHKDINKMQHNTNAALEIENYFINRYTTSSGPQVETMLSALGAVSGFGCQMAIREAFIKTGKVSEQRAFMVVGTKNGEKYYFGDLLNQPIASPKQISVLTLVSGGAVKAGAKPESLPNTDDIFKHTAQVVGTKEFGIPRIPTNHFPKELPIQSLRATWNDIENIQKKNEIDPEFLGWMPAQAAQKIIIKYKDKIDPSLAAKIVMESAIPMSKVDPNTVIK